jgi:hypothetical protein
MSFYANWLTVGVVIELFPWFIAGVLIFWRRANSWFGLLFSLSLLLAGISIIDPAIALWAELALPTTGWLINSLSFIGTTLITIWFFFPNGKLYHRLVWGIIGFWILRNMGLWFFPETLLAADNWPVWLNLGINYCFALTFVAVSVSRYRRSDIVQRQQIKWVVVAMSVFIVMYILQEVVFLRLEQGREVIIANFTITSLYYLASGVLASSIVVAILRYRLFDIDIIIRRTVQYGVVSALLAAIYFGTITLIQGGITAVTSTQSPFAIVLSTLLIAALFNPLRQRVQTFIDRRFYRQKYDAQQVLAQFAQTARDEVDMEALQAELLRVVQETMQPEMIAIWVKPTEN